MKLLLKEAVGYALASAVALAADVALLFLLVHFFGWWYLAAATASFTAGIFVAYGISVGLVFRERRIEDRRMEFVTFAMIGAVGLGVNAAAMFVAVRYLGLNYLAAKAVAAGFTFVGNFVSRRQLLFVRPSAA